MCVCARPLIIGERARNTPAPAGPSAPRPAAAAPSSLSSQFYHWHLPVSYAMYTQNLSCGPGWVRDRVGLSARHIHCTGKRSLARPPEVARLGRRLRVPTLRLPEVLLQRRHPRPPPFLISVTNIYRTVGTPNRSRLVVHHRRSPVRHANIYRTVEYRKKRSLVCSLARSPPCRQRHRRLRIALCLGHRRHHRKLQAVDVGLRSTVLGSVCPLFVCEILGCNRGN
jgi:hypothetical protein